MKKKTDESSRYDIVTADWIREQILDLKLSDTVVADEMEITRADLSAYKTGYKPLSAVRKQAFFYYFYYKSAHQLWQE